MGLDFTFVAYVALTQKIEQDLRNIMATVPLTPPDIQQVIRDIVTVLPMKWRSWG